MATKTHTTAISQNTIIDDRTIRRLEAQVPDADTADRTDGRVGWSYYGIDTDGTSWTWTVYNGNPETHHEDFLADLDDDEMIDHIQAVADEIEDWDSEYADWLRGELDAAEARRTDD